MRVLLLLVGLLLIPSVNAQIVISEVLYDAVGADAGQEFVELYNPLATAQSIEGWQLERGNGANAGDWVTEAVLTGSIPAHSFYLIGEANVTGADLTTNLDLQNGPDAIRLVDDHGEVRDLVGWGVSAIDKATR